MHTLTTLGISLGFAILSSVAPAQADGGTLLTLLTPRIGAEALAGLSPDTLALLGRFADCAVELGGHSLTPGAKLDAGRCTPRSRDAEEAVVRDGKTRAHAKELLGRVLIEGFRIAFADHVFRRESGDPKAIAAEADAARQTTAKKASGPAPNENSLCPGRMIMTRDGCQPR
jgi:hypothetical protein